jgi:hypothetical protein
MRIDKSFYSNKIESARQSDRQRFNVRSRQKLDADRQHRFVFNCVSENRHRGDCFRFYKAFEIRGIVHILDNQCIDTTFFVGERIEYGIAEQLFHIAGKICRARQRRDMNRADY